MGTSLYTAQQGLLSPTNSHFSVYFWKQDQMLDRTTRESINIHDVSASNTYSGLRGGLVLQA